MTGETTKQLLGNIKGPKGDKGDTGTGIVSITEGTTSTSNGVTSTTYNVNLSNSDVETFEVVHGAAGATGAQGPQGPQGEPFAIGETYATIAAMNADAANVEEGTFVIITSASGAEDEDNAKLYVKGASSFEYITDLSGAQGIQGIGIKSIVSDGIVSGIAGQGGTRQISIYLTNDTNNTNPIQVQFQDGAKGDTGATGATGATGNGISSISKTGTSGLVDTYTISYTDANASSSTFTVTNGAQGVPGLIPYISIDSEVGDTPGTGNLYVEYLTPEQYAQMVSNNNSGS